MSLSEFGTVAFDRDMIRRLIGFDVLGGGIMQFGPWLSFVPPVYREIAERQCLAVVERWLGRAISEREVGVMIEEIRIECVREIRMRKETP